MTEDQRSHVSWFWYALLWPLHQLVMAIWFRYRVVGVERIPKTGPVILAPTHRTRWDILVLALVGRRILRAMTTQDEFLGPQRFFMNRLGAFAINPKRPSTETIRQCRDLLNAGRTLVIFPEGRLYALPPDHIGPVQSGTAWIALQCLRKMDQESIPIVPIRLNYHDPGAGFRSRVEVRVCEPIQVTRDDLEQHRDAVDRITQTLTSRLGEIPFEPTPEQLAKANQRADAYRRRIAPDHPHHEQESTPTPTT